MKNPPKTWLNLLAILGKIKMDEDDLARYGHMSAYLDDQKRVKVGLGSREAGEIFLHRLILPGVAYVDHMNRDPSDNRKSNLRPCTLTQNQGNRSVGINNTSGYKGVSWHTTARKWRARIAIIDKYGKNTEIHLGLFKDKKAAARAYNKAALEYFGEFALLNEV